MKSVFCSTHGDYFRAVQGNTMTPQIGVVYNSSDGRYQWVRMGMQNPVFQAAPYWAIDPISGSDENQGWGASQAAAEAVALKTLAELNRRLVGVDVSSTVRISLLGSVGTSDATVLTNMRSTNGLGRPVIVGTKTQVGGDYTVSAYATAVPASNTGYLLSATGLGAAGNVGKLVTNAAGTKWAFVQASMGANQVRLTQPNAFDVLALAGSFSASFTAGETIRVWSLPVLQKWPFPMDVLFPAVDTCEIRGAFSAANASPAMLGDGYPVIGHSILNGVQFNGSNTPSIIGCQFSTTGSTVSGAHSVQLFACGLRGTGNMLLFTSSTILFSQNNDIEGCTLSLSDHSRAFANDPSTNISIFNVLTGGLDAAIFANAHGEFSAYGANTALYGSGNTAFIFKCGPGSSSAFSKAVCTATTSKTKPLSIAGTTYDYASIPIADAGTVGTFVNDGI